MKVIRLGCVLFLMVFTSNVFSQTTALEGQVITDLEAENIHVINRTSQKFTITNALGFFTIPSKLHDTLIISSIQHELVSVIIDAEMLENKKFQIFLKPLINMLDEVVVGKVLSGNLMQDLQNVEGTPMTALKAGISSYQGKMPSQSERRLSYARSGMIGMIVNSLNGNIKRFKMQVQLEEKEELIHKIRAAQEANLFASFPLEPNLQMEFWYFCSEDPNFLERCKNKNGVLVLQYLIEKLEVYKENRSE